MENRGGENVPFGTQESIEFVLKMTNHLGGLSVLRLNGD